MASDHIGELKKWVNEITHSDGEAGPLPFNHAIQLIAKNFGVQPDEVAILAFTPDERSLHFLAPDNLRPIGEIPLSSITSLAVRTIRERRPEVVNRLSMVPHATVFEAVPIAEDRRGEQIHKIMSAPILLDNRVVGVLQVSRKAAEAAEAGPDFTQAQLRELVIICETIAPCVVLSRRESTRHIS